MRRSNLLGLHLASAACSPYGVDWFNTRRLLEPIDYVPPAEYEATYYQQTETMAFT